MKQEVDNNLLACCFESAMKVGFLETSWEIKLYAYTLYNAKMWGKNTK